MRPLRGPRPSRPTVRDRPHADRRVGTGHRRTCSTGLAFPPRRVGHTILRHGLIHPPQAADHHRRRLRRDQPRQAAPRRADRHPAGRPAQLPPVPAAAVPGRDGGAVAGGHRVPDPADLPLAAQRAASCSATVDRIDLANRQVCGGDVCVDFDYLAVCVGATHSYFGKDEPWRQLAPGLKDLDDATEIRRRVLLAFEEAELEQDEASRRAKLTFVVVGGGPTGVEMAGALREIAANDIQKDFRNIDTGTSRIILVQGGDRLLPQFDASLSERAKRDLEAMGVEVRLNAPRHRRRRARRVDRRASTCRRRTSSGPPASRAPKLLATMGVRDRPRRAASSSGRTCRCPGHPNVFVLGDAANVDGRQDRQARARAWRPRRCRWASTSARIIRDEVRDGAAPAATSAPAVPLPRQGHHGDDRHAPRRRRHPRLALRRRARVARVVAVHVMFLIGFRNRLFVMAGWIYDYLAERPRSAADHRVVQAESARPAARAAHPDPVGPPPESVRGGLDGDDGVDLAVTESGITPTRR